MPRTHRVNLEDLPRQRRDDCTYLIELDGTRYDPIELDGTRYDPIEVAEHYAALQRTGHTQRAIAGQLGVSQTQISKRLNLLSLPPEQQHAVRRGNLPLEHPQRMRTTARRQTQNSRADDLA